MTRLLCLFFSFLYFIPLFSVQEIKPSSTELTYFEVAEDGAKRITKEFGLDFEEYQKVFAGRKTLIPVFNVLTPPKGGSHLLVKALTMMTGIPYSWGKAPSTFNLAHFTDALSQLSIQSPIKTITIIRDPRDILISQCFWFPVRLKKVRGIVSIEDRCKLLLNQPELLHDYEIGLQLESMQQLVENKKNVFVARFENLVGAHGKGSLEVQRKELMDMAQFLEISLTEEQLNYIIDKLFGNSPTFREGQIGSWLTYFDDEIKALFKQVYGKYLFQFGYEEDDNW